MNKAKLYTASFLLLLHVFCVLSCKKYRESADHLPGSDYVRGRFFLKDNLLRGGDSSAAGKVMVRLSDQPTGEDFIFSDTTDADGYFLFEHLKGGDRPYFLIAEFMQDSIIYYLRSPVDALNQDAIYTLTTKADGQTGAGFTVRDPAGVLLPGARICLFSNPVFAADTSCAGSIWSGTTNSYGQAFKASLKPGKYYAQIKYKSGTSSYFKRDTFDLAAEQIARRDVPLAPVEVIAGNQITYIVVDAANRILPNAVVCGFTSLVTANDTCFGANWSGPTDNSGKVIFKDMPPATYYVFGRLKAGSIDLKDRDTMILGQSTQFTDTLHLK